MRSNLAYVICFILFQILLFSSCNCLNKDLIGNKNLKITASKIVIEPFDTIALKLNLSKEEIQLKYDSIFWIGDGQANEPLSNSLDSNIIINNQNFALKKSVTDYRIGKHKVYIKTYKNKIASLSDSIEFEVLYPTGDFLSFKRNEKKAEYLFFNPKLTQEHRNYGPY